MYFSYLGRSMQVQFLRFVDENWGGSRTFKVGDTNGGAGGTRNCTTFAVSYLKLYNFCLGGGGGCTCTCLWVYNIYYYVAFVVGLSTLC